MNVYVTMHLDVFFADQLDAIARYVPNPKVHVVATRNAANNVLAMASIKLACISTRSLVRALLPLVDDGPGLILEWDIIPTAPIHVRDAVNVSDGYGVYPSALIWSSKDRLSLNDDRLFVDANYTVLQQRWMESGCGAANNFSTIGNQFLHFHHWAGGRVPFGVTKERWDCWRSIVDQTPRAGLGDMVAAGLSAVGITKERVQAVAQAVGIKDCGCPGRQAALNRLGAKLGLPPGTLPPT